VPQQRAEAVDERFLVFGVAGTDAGALDFQRGRDGATVEVSSSGARAGVEPSS